MFASGTPTEVQPGFGRDPNRTLSVADGGVSLYSPELVVVPRTVKPRVLPRWVLTVRSSLALLIS